MTYSFRTNGNFIDFVHTDNTNQAVESVLRSLHNTSRCVTWSLPEDTTRISFVVDDIRVDNFILTEIDFDGVAIDSQDDFETGIEAAFPGGGGGGGVQSVNAGTGVTVTGTATDPIINASGSSSYLVYTGILSQTDADPPIATLLQNTIGGGTTYTKGGVGVYHTETDVLASERSKFYVSGMSNPYTAGTGALPITDEGSIIGYVIIDFSEGTGVIINIYVYDDSFASVELSTLIGNTGRFCLPKIEYYP